MQESRFNEEDFADYLQELINHHRLEDAPLGITTRVIDRGYNVLSAKQKYVFINETIIKNSVEKCERCEIDIPWCEMLEATENGGLCNYCFHMKEKMMKE